MTGGRCVQEFTYITLVGDCLSKVDPNEVPTCDLKVNIFSRNSLIRNLLSTSLWEPADSSAHTVTSGKRDSESEMAPQLIHLEWQVGKDRPMDAGSPSSELWAPHPPGCVTLDNP